VLIRRLIRMWQIAVLAGVALAFSDGIALAYRIMRSELLSSALVFLALLLTLIAAREGPNGRRFLNLGLAALLVSLSLTEKVQALLPALTIPVIALAFGKDERDASASAVSQGAWLRAVILCSLGLVLVVPTIGLVEDGLTGMASSHLFQYRPLFANWPGLYQWLLVAYVAFGMVLYASIWRVRPLDTALGLMAVLVGLALGLLALYGRYDLNVVIPVVNPVEHLHAVSGSPGANLPTTSIAMLASQFLTGLGKALAVHTFFLSPSHRPTLLFEWLTKTRRPMLAAFLGSLGVQHDQGLTDADFMTSTPPEKLVESGKLPIAKIIDGRIRAEDVVSKGFDVLTGAGNDKLKILVSTQL